MKFDAGALRKLMLPAVLVLLVLVGSGVYYVYLVKAKESYLIRSNLRLLTTTGRQVEDWVAARQRFFKTMIQSAHPEELARAWEATRETREKLPTPVFVTLKPGAPQDQVKPPELFLDAGGRLWLAQRSEAGASHRVPFDVPILETVRQDVFDIVLLTTPDGKILMRSNEEDLHLTDLHSLFEKKETFTREVGHTTDLGVLISGTPYRLFAQPCCSLVRARFEDKTGETIGPGSGREATPTPTPAPTGTPVAPASTVASDRTGLVVCGLIPTAKLTERKFTISYSAMLILAGGLLMIVVSWPFLKLLLIGPGQRVRLIDVLLLGVSSLLVLSLGTLYLLDWYAYYRLKNHIDEGLKVLSQDIRANMRTEIAAAYSQLTGLVKASVAPPHPGDVAAEQPISEPDLLRRHPGLDLSFYPFFESFTLIDREGQQTTKWSVRKTLIPPIPVVAREYFRRAKDHDLWNLPEECGAYRNLPEGRKCVSRVPGIGPLTLESIKSITRMENQAVLAIPNNSDRLPVASLSFPMISLIRPVLPPGFGFAVIEDKEPGKVLFHSDERRNLIERFYLETNLNRPLRSVVAARREEVLDIEYWGNDYRAFVAPLKGFPWSLVTFYENDIVRSVNVDWIVTALGFLLIYVLLWVFASLIVVYRPDKRATWLWPHPKGLLVYLRLSALYVGLIAVFGWVIYLAGRETRLGRISDFSLGLYFFYFGVPAVAWVATYLTLKRSERKAERVSPPTTERVSAPTAEPVSAPTAEPAPEAGSKSEASHPPRSSAAKVSGSGSSFEAEPSALLSLTYVTAATLLLIITAVMPTIAFFKLAHSIQVMPLIKYTQVRLAAEIEDRWQRAQKELEAVSRPSREKDLSPGSRPASDSNKPDNLLSRRRAIEEETQLRYLDGNGQAQKAPAVDIYGQVFGSRMARTSEETGPADERPILLELLEPMLPYYSEFSVAIRELLHDRAADESRFWRREGGNRIALTSNAYSGGKLRISSVVPTFGSVGSLFERRRHVAIVALVFGLVGLLALVVALFIARRVFLMDLPFWSSGPSSFPGPAQSLFVVCRNEVARAAYLAIKGYRLLDVKHLAAPTRARDAWEGWLAELDNALSGEPILLDNFEEGGSDSGISVRKLRLVEHLLKVRRRRLVILSRMAPHPLFRGRRGVGSGSEPEDDRGIEKRWDSLVTSHFLIVDLEPRFETDAFFEPPGRITKLGDELKKLGTGWHAKLSRFSDWVRVRQHGSVREVLEREYAGNPYLYVIHNDLDRMISRRGEQNLDRDEILEEFSERAANYYAGLWACCTDIEKLVLEHLAEDGFANHRDARTVRRLVARGLVRRDPHLRIMNETFRRFVLSARCRKEVDEVEQRTKASLWDHFQRPFVGIVVVLLVLFVVTQKTRFDGVTAFVAGLTGLLPALLKLIGYLLGDRSELPIKPG